ncbi:MAG TPA: sigma-54 dependent transcriptional regulator [Myxococcota bacterium]|jgi:two-component system response regulator HydG|nr:sigma-54 dependent transcriptional regulator [Myxococcota bacterium]
MPPAANAGAPGRILVVDDEPAICHIVKEMLSPSGAAITTCPGPREALAALAAEPFDLLIVDYHMPQMTGMEVIAEARRLYPELRVILMSAMDPSRIVTDSSPTGAYDFLAKPVTAQELRLRVQRAFREMDLLRDAATGPRARARERTALKRKDDLFIGSSLAVRSIFEQIAVVTHNDIPVLVTGESGTGKELVARTIHHLSQRFEQPFVAVNCSAIPDTLMEAELFGHTRGAFTGATTDRDGLFAASHGGTIFLDEIGELSLGAQVKLLRVLERGEFRRVGETQDRTVDVRLISATNRDLEGAVKEARFREDLYYRINVFAIRLPPLRERREDIPMLANHFARRHAPPDGPALRIDREALLRLIAHDWPGNVRELENVMRQAIALAEGGVIRAKDIRLLAGARAGSVADLDLDLPFRALKEKVLADLERDYVAGLLRRHEGNVSAAARAAGLHRKNFWSLMQKNGIDPESFKK